MDENKKAFTYWNSLLYNSDQKKNPMKKNAEKLSKDLDLPPDLLSSEGEMIEGETIENPSELQKIAIQGRKMINLFNPLNKSNISIEELNEWKELADSWGAGDEDSPGFILSEEKIKAALENMEYSLIEKMPLMDILKDDELVNKITPSIKMIETLLGYKNRLSGKTLENAKKIIQKYVDQVVELFNLIFTKSVKKIHNPDINPKKVFRNLNLKRTIWQNLPNWDPETKKLYVDKLYYHRAAKKSLPAHVIIVVDQSGSMTECMVQSTIMASIFASLPNLNVQLLAFDTKVIDLSEYVNNPFEVLLQTRLGGGTYINKALIEGIKKIENPRQTAFVLITDYYEMGSEKNMLDSILKIKKMGVTFLSVGSINNSGRATINNKFVNTLRINGIPTIIGGPEDLIYALKNFL